MEFCDLLSQNWSEVAEDWPSNPGSDKPRPSAIPAMPVRLHTIYYCFCIAMEYGKTENIDYLLFTEKN